MSFSSCVGCGEMVPCYEKYCSRCVERYGVKQDAEFHKHTYLRWEDYDAEFAKDRKAASEAKEIRPRANL